ncbi:hypothetical protein N7466_003068 [Penicillium verhagenii]|uniref:uncharacterized protein n=1 Tax=Penicillium verhagenii TaxID=1562060 RepID=UPI002544DA61|nr:uncharacterized protein N7466_003068 [Penicillium verhagenii]KAJ5936618.1 hypothetical protein N7466_003068 [Penicillium verhagenii]
MSLTGPAMRTDQRILAILVIVLDVGVVGASDSICGNANGCLLNGIIKEKERGQRSLKKFCEN